MDKNIASMDVWLVLNFLEFPVYNKNLLLQFLTLYLLSKPNVNYIDSTAFLDKRVSMFIKSLKINRHFRVLLKPIIDLNMLHNTACDSLHLGYILKQFIQLVFLFFENFKLGSTLHGFLLTLQTACSS